MARRLLRHYRNRLAGVLAPALVTHRSQVHKRMCRATKWTNLLAPLPETNRSALFFELLNEGTHRKIFELCSMSCGPRLFRLDLPAQMVVKIHQTAFGVFHGHHGRLCRGIPDRWLAQRPPVLSRYVLPVSHSLPLRCPLSAFPARSSHASARRGLSIRSYHYAGPRGSTTRGKPD
jgi:hypothetical protein